MLNTDRNNELEHDPTDDADYNAWLRERALVQAETSQSSQRAALGEALPALEQENLSKIKTPRSLAWAKLLIVLVPLFFWLVTIHTRLSRELHSLV